VINIGFICSQLIEAVWLELKFKKFLPVFDYIVLIVFKHDDYFPQVIGCLCFLVSVKM